MADLIIAGKYVVTMDKRRRVIEDGAVVIEEGRIIALGKSQEMKTQYDADRVIEGKKYLVLPGLVDAHTHVFQCLGRGLGDDLPVEEWAEKSMYPLAKVMTRDEFYWAAKLNALEMIKSGTTTFADSHFIHIDKYSIDGIADGTLESGLRALIVRATQSRSPEEFIEDIVTAKRETKRVFNKYNGREGRITVVPEVISFLRSDEEFILEMKQLADELGNGLHAHVSETLDRYKTIKSRTGLGEIEYIEKLGILDKNLLMAHVIWVSSKEIVAIKKANAKVAHNPVSNQYLADGYADIPLMRALDITVGIGCDGASSNNNQDMIEAMKLCALMHKTHTLNASVLTAEDVLEMATIEGAKALRMEETIGSLEIGKRADFAVIDLEKPHLTPCPRPISNLVYSANGSDVVYTIVDGKILMEERSVTTLDEQRILEKTEEITTELIVKSNLSELVQKGEFNIYGMGNFAPNNP